MSATISKQLARPLSVARSLLPPVLKPSKGNLYEVLSRTPTGGVGSEIYQTRWNHKDITDSYWVVTRSKFKDEGRHGRAWGRLYWKGVLVSQREEEIRGGLKYTWREGRSQGIAESESQGKSS